MTAIAERSDAHACYAAALRTVEPAVLVQRFLVREAGRLVLLDADARPRAVHAGPAVLVGAGKAGLAMASAARVTLGMAAVGGAIVVPHGATGDVPDGVVVGTGAHPVPDQAGVAATHAVLARTAAAGADSLVVVVLSGGASALLVAPPAEVPLVDKCTLTARLLVAGADIRAVNAVRRHCSRVKGGGLARAARRAAGLWTLILSDVIGDDLATIGSGPTVGDPTTFATAEAALATHLSPDDVPASIRTHLARGRAGAIPETVKPGDPVLARTHAQLIGGNPDAVAAVATAARAHGYTVEILPAPLTGDAAAAGRLVVARLRALPRDRPVAVVAGGETTVRVVPGGRGGRSQHLALAAACALAGDAGVVLAAGTDGIDGPTSAAGACIDGGTCARARARGADPEGALAATDSHSLLTATGDAIVTGPTGTNVADVVIALRRAP